MYIAAATSKQKRVSPAEIRLPTRYNGRSRTGKAEKIQLLHLWPGSHLVHPSRSHMCSYVESLPWKEQRTIIYQVISRTAGKLLSDGAGRIFAIDSCRACTKPFWTQMDWTHLNSTRGNYGVLPESMKPAWYFTIKTNKQANTKTQQQEQQEQPTIAACTQMCPVTTALCWAVSKFITWIRINPVVFYPLLLLIAYFNNSS